MGSAADRADWPRILPALAADGVEWLVVKPTAHPGSLDDLRASMEFLKLCKANDKPFMPTGMKTGKEQKP